MIDLVKNLLGENVLVAAIGGPILLGAISLISKKIPRAKMEKVLDDLKKWGNGLANKIISGATLPAYVFGVGFSKLIVSKIGSKSAEAVENGIILTLTTFAKKAFEILVDSFFRPILQIPEKAIEQFERGMLADNKKGVK